MEKQVTLVEVTAGPKGPKNQADSLPESPGRAILETTSGSAEKTEPVCEVLPSGIRVLHITEGAEASDDAGHSIELLQGMSGTTDYLLVDLPFKPSPFTRSVLAICELVVIASGYKLKDISEINNFIRLLDFSGISPQRIAAILIDPEGTFPGAALGSIKPYFEASLGIDLAGVISFDAKLYQLSYLENQPLMKSGQNSQFAQNIRQIARHILTHNVMKRDPLRPTARVPHLEKGK
jgi:Flp pilus assembly CpaE family ATPase